ncbi:MAG: tetratricopeptide repeat protein [Alphaproteobacteria bacterium]|nr:tetratricopeptide repeat protein [Alphaproteobacteria bacterium]MBU2084793.1 tetratricopeptide repeat protein [Alphaproteobacteria bacterium]MBU2144129.1 tetratricopeptide repeat protein [Alphaproteobacteria bacterium]MBU2198244.1 tetratricopeptide repeat protein [Alphaproteobacteria bacterium]
MLKPLILAAILLAGQASAAPSDEMFQKLHDAPSESEANDAAQDIWAAWMESGSPTVDMIMERAVDAQTVGEFDTARALYDRAVMLEPDYAEAWSRRASLFLNDENFPEALRDLNEALRLEPRHFGAWAGLGIMMETMGAEKEALEAYRQALDIYPFMTQALQAEKRLAKQAEGQGL